MRNNKLLIIIFFIIMSFICIPEVSAVTVDDRSCSDPYNINISVYGRYTLWGDHSISSNNSWKFNSGGRIVYCSAKGVPVDDDDANYVSYQSLDDGSEGLSTNNLMARVLAYGYIGNNDENCSVARIGTQVVVHMAAKEIATGNSTWRSLTQSQIASMFSGSSANSIAAYAYNLKTKVLTHGVVPSFSHSTSSAASSASNRVTLQYSETNRNFFNSLNDTNSILSTWALGSNPSGITTSKSGNNLTITSKDDSQTTPINMYKAFMTNATTYRRVVGSYQPTVYSTPPSNKTVYAYVGYKYQEIGKGTVKVHKIDKYTGKNMQGAKFGIFSDDKCTVKAKDYLGNELPEKTTDKNGFVSWGNLYYPLEEGGKRTYYLKETEVIDGYSIDNEQMEMLGAGENACVPVEVNAEVVSSEEAEEVEYEKNDVEVQAIYNIPYGNITILKQDSETGEVIEGVEFRLLKYNKDRDPATDIYGNEVENAVTGENGVAEFENIPYGDYILEEVKANGSYKILEEPIEFTLDANTDALKYRDQGTEAIPEEDEVLLPLETYRLGDPTDDGVIDSNDLTIIVGILEGTITEEDITKVYRYASDVDQDGSITEKDKELMSAYLGGDPNAFEALKEIEYPGQFQKRVTIVVTNVPIDMKVSKQAITNEKELKGATITIENSEGEVFIKYKSTGKPYEFYIPVGDYTLIEEIAPNGYQNLKTEVEFRVGTDGNIKLLSAESNMYKLIKSQEEDDNDLDHLIIYNNLKRVIVPNTGSTIAFLSIIGGAALIGGGGYAIYRRYKTS